MIYLTNRAEKDLHGFSHVERRRILKKLEQADFSPKSPQVKKIQTTKGREVEIYRLRMGVYRLLFTWEGEDVVIFRIVHRRDLEKALREYT